MKIRMDDWRIWLPMMALTIILSVAIVWGYWNAVRNREFAERIQANRIERITQLHEQCLRIEELFTARREEARANYNNLERDARLLGVKLTPELRRTAQQARAATIKRFAAKPCPPPMEETP